VTQRFPPTNIYERLYQRLKEAEKRLDNLENKPYPTIPLYDSGNFPQNPIEQQIVITFGQPTAVVLSELGWTGVLGGAASTTRVLTMSYTDVLTHDAILVITAAPEKPTSGTGPYTCTGVTDSVGNTYSLVGTANWDASSPVAQEGAQVKIWYCDDSNGPMSAGVDTITATWNGAVYANLIIAYSVARSGGPNITLLSKTPDHDSGGSYLTDYVDAPSFTFTPTRPGALVFAQFMVMAKTGDANLYAYSGHGSAIHYSIMDTGAASASGAPNGFHYDFFAGQASGEVTHVVTVTPNYFYATGTLSDPATGTDWYPGMNFSTGPPIAVGGGINKWKGVIMLGFD
jgi:hypothetical protein